LAGGLAGALALTGGGLARAQDATPEAAEDLTNPMFLFVQLAEEGTWLPSVDDPEIYELSLGGISSQTVYFSDRPERVVGHLTTQEFVDIWDDGDDSFAKDPPNAVLSFVARGSDVPHNTVIEISDPMLNGGDLSYSAKILEGTLPATADGCTLFIDPFGRPLSPVSLAGMNRRDRRRDRRRR